MFTLVLADKYKWSRVSMAAVWIVLLFSVYCLAAGIFLLAGWQHPLAGASAEQISHVTVSARDRGGIFIYNEVMVLWYSSR